MSQKKIEFPKVFISYAWGTAEYQEKVLAFSASLVESGIEVILDKWNLIEGNDTYAFMERCVNDESVTNVLMLLDPLYAEKANSHTGGVGTETQIISAQIYQNVQQSKFIPIVFERDSDGNVYKPTYLQSRLHFDLEGGSAEIWIPADSKKQYEPLKTVIEDNSAEKTETKANPVMPQRASDGKSLEEMSVEELQAEVLARLSANGPLTDRMIREVQENVYRDSLLNWVKSFR